MLHNFLTNNRSELIARCRDKVARREHSATPQQLLHGVPLFLNQLIVALRRVAAASGEPVGTPGTNSTDASTQTAIGASATLHGKDMLDLGFKVDEVVHNYGDLCQAISDLAVERDAPFTVDEFRTLNHCLDVAIAHAVTAFSQQHEVQAADRHDAEENQRMGFFVHELRNHLGTAQLALAACKAGNLPLDGATGSILARSCNGMGIMIDGAIELVRDAHQHEAQSLFALADFVAEAEATTSLAASAKECRLHVPTMDRRLAVRGNRPMLLAALVNLLQNAFKYTHSNSVVTLTCHAVGESILIEVADHCGGIGAGLAQRMFQPFEQGAADRTGLGLGLTIARQFVEDNGGRLSVRDVPGVGCVFTITLPYYIMPE